MKRLFLAGPYRAETPYQVYLNIRKAEKKAVELWQEGYNVLCPHLNTQLFEQMMENAHETVMPGYLEWVEVSDIIYMMEGWRSSEGAKAELKVAKKNNLEVIYE